MTDLATGAARLDGYRRTGAAAVRDLIDDAWIELLREIVPGLVAGARNGMWRSSEPFARFLLQSPVGDTAGFYMRSGTVRLYEDLLLYKEAGEDGTTGWHRDAPHWPLSGEQMCSIWLSLDAVAGDGDSIGFVAGSHADADELVDLRSIMVDETAITDREIVSFQTEPGDVIVFHPRALHMVRTSVNERPRRTFTLRFVGDDVRWRPRRSYYHQWMADCGLRKGDRLDHPWFPVVRR
jgi:ectoine hydroxylase-related dioxygenase (phytanoyl-CoA dioxygenase family)